VRDASLVPRGPRRCTGDRHGGCLQGGTTQSSGDDIMGKYFLAWILGVPIGVLVLIYLFMH
jgi:hypothetical protein